MSKLYRPSNGTEGLSFMERFCYACERDAKYRETELGEDSCPIASEATLGGGAKEWSYDAKGEPTCTAFEPEVSEEVRREREERAALIAAGQKDLFS